jgi:hypothetical protein
VERGIPSRRFVDLFTSYSDHSLTHTFNIYQGQNNNFVPTFAERVSANCPLLTNLHCAEINIEFLMTISHRLSTMEQIETDKIDAVSLKNIALYCRNLRHFYNTNSNCSFSSDDFTDLINHNPFLTHLRVTIKIDDKRNKDIGQILIMRHSALVEVHLYLVGQYNCSFNAFIKRLSLKASKIESFTIRNNTESCCELTYNSKPFTKIGFIKTIEYGRLLVLKSVSVNKGELLFFLQVCPPLREIRLMNLKRVIIDGDFIEVLIKFHFSTLKILKVQNTNSLISVKHLEKLDSFPCLQKVDLDVNNKCGITFELHDSCVFEYLTVH